MLCEDMEASGPGLICRECTVVPLGSATQIPRDLECVQIGSGAGSRLQEVASGIDRR